MAANRPQLWWQVAFSADPNDPDAVRVWTDLSGMVQRVRQMARGRQYELAKSQAGQPSMLFLDPSEHLNQANTSSPYHPNVQPLREILGQAMWPNEGTGNLLNPFMWMPNDVAPLDPSFEAYANGADVPATVTEVGGTVATISTTNPQQGTKSATYTVAATAVWQGLSWEVPCVPGQEYTLSAYVRQSSASTQRISVTDQTLAVDTFTGRTVASGFGTPTFGAAWSISGGSAADYNVANGAGTIATAGVSVDREAFLNVGTPDHTAYARFLIPVLPTSGAIVQWVTARRTDFNNLYACQFAILPDGTALAFLVKRVAGVQTDITSVALPTVHRPGDIWNVELGAVAGSQAIYVWRDGQVKPSTPTLTGTDAALSAGNTAGVMARGNTDTYTTSFYAFHAVGYVHGSTTATTGSYVRLSATWTATQPAHVVQVATSGTAVAGTVNIDAIQHEPGGSASAFTTDGPNVFPLMLDNVERWPRTNQPDTSGFAGMCDTTAVDGFGALNAVTLDLDYPAAMMATEPAYLWRLDAGSGSSFGLETSGNNGPPLVPTDSKYGPDTPPEFGAQMDIPGAYSATGVRFTPTDLISAHVPGTFLACGRSPVTPGIRWPQAFGATSWALSMSCWVRITQTDPPTSQIILLPSVGLTTSNPTLFYMTTTTSGNAIAVSHSPFNGADIIAGDVTAVMDGLPHLLVATMTQASGGNTVVKLYVDGVLSDTDTATTASMGGMYTTPMTGLGIGGGWTGGFTPNGSVNYAGLWERELSADEVEDLWAAGGLGFAGELTGARLTRRLEQGGWTGRTRISAGSSTMQPSTAGVTDALSDAQNITTVEDGTFWVAPDGAVVMEGRQQRWLRLTPRGVFGEDEASGEIPYLDGVAFDFDPSFVAANVRVSRVNGTTAIGGTLAEIAAVSRRFFPRSSPPDTNDYETDQLAQDKADWTFNTHKAPLLRVSMLTVDLGANPGLATKVLGIEVGQRWTVKRRAKAANAGAGLTMSEDYFIERISHDEIDLQSGRWRVSFLMSPVGLITNDPGVTFQPWILEHSTYGVLGSTTVLGW